MNVRTIHTVKEEQFQNAWDNAVPPVLTAVENEAVTIQAREASNDQILNGSSVEAVTELDFARVNPVHGPVAIQGARPGDILQVDIHAIEVQPWGWTANIPGFGLLAQTSPEVGLRIVALSEANAVASQHHLFPGARYACSQAPAS
jgi:acetamidase/formamidase